MQVEVVSEPVGKVEADVRVVGLQQGGSLPAELAEVPGVADAKGAFKKLAVLYPHDSRALVAGLGEADELDPERLRVVAALAANRAAAFDARSLAWALPDGVDPGEAAGALVEGTILASYRFDRYRSRDADDPEPPRIERLTIAGSGEEAVMRAAEIARVAAEAANRARTLQDRPSNDLTPAGAR